MAELSPELDHETAHIRGFCHISALQAMLSIGPQLDEFPWLCNCLIAGSELAFYIENLDRVRVNPGVPLGGDGRHQAVMVEMRMSDYEALDVAEPKPQFRQPGAKGVLGLTGLNARIDERARRHSASNCTTASEPTLSFLARSTRYQMSKVSMFQPVSMSGCTMARKIETALMSVASEAKV